MIAANSRLERLGLPPRGVVTIQDTLAGRDRGGTSLTGRRGILGFYVPGKDVLVRQGMPKSKDLLVRRGLLVQRRELPVR